MTEDMSAAELRETITTVLAEHPVSIGFLFGSRSRGDAETASDVDVAVAFEERSSQQSGARVRLGTDLALALGTDDIDVVDLRSAPRPLIRAVLEEGTCLVGTDAAVDQLRAELLTEADKDSRSPAERFDDALADIDDHLA